MKPLSSIRLTPVCRGRFAKRRRDRALALAIVTLIAAASPALAADPSPECGLFRDYVAPDPGSDTPGSISFGLSGSAEVISATAVLVPPADTSLSMLQGGVPTCLEVTRDAGQITRLAFLASGEVQGAVTFVEDLFGPGSDGYVIADRVFAVAADVLSNTWETALIKTAADSGGELSIAFVIDVTTGFPTGFGAGTQLSGAVTLTGGDDILVGAATIPGAVIDADARSELSAAAAAGESVLVVIAAIGTIDIQGGGQTVGQVTLDVSRLPDTATPAPPGWPMLAVLTAGVILFLSVLGASVRRRF